jgi:hypothetical protein
MKKMLKWILIACYKAFFEQLTVIPPFICFLLCLEHEVLPTCSQNPSNGPWLEATHSSSCVCPISCYPIYWIIYKHCSHLGSTPVLYLECSGLKSCPRGWLSWLSFFRVFLVPPGNTVIAPHYAITNFFHLIFDSFDLIWCFSPEFLTLLLNYQ